MRELELSVGQGATGKILEGGKIYAAQSLFSTAHGERNFVQKEGRNS